MVIHKFTLYCSQPKSAIFEGYRSVKEISVEIESQLPLFIAARYLFLVLYLTGKSWEERFLQLTASKYIPIYIDKTKKIVLKNN